MQPTFSVVIPTYEPDGFLIEAVKSVLAQDLGERTMQIAIVDDASPRTRPGSLLEQLAPAGRIEIYEHDHNLGLAGNWNRAISLARGEFIHILHQDDTVREGFYARLSAGLNRSSRIGMAFCRHAFVDSDGHVSRVSHRQRWRAGVLSHWLERIGEAQRIQCPAAIVRRDVYEALGGFRSDLRYALDWEMWVRIAAKYSVWYEPSVLAYYRRHSGNETARLRASGLISTDVLQAIETFAEHFPPERRNQLKHRTYRRMVHSHLRRSGKMLDQGLNDGARAQLGLVHDVLQRMPDSFGKRLSRHRLARLETRCGKFAVQ